MMMMIKILLNGSIKRGVHVVPCTEIFGTVGRPKLRKRQTKIVNI